MRVNEGKWVVKSLDGQEKRFNDPNSPEAKAWQQYRRPVKPAKYTDGWWEDKDESPVPSSRLNYSDSDEIMRITSENNGGDISHFNFLQYGVVDVEGTTCATAVVAVTIAYDPAELGLEAPPKRRSSVHPRLLQPEPVIGTVNIKMRRDRVRPEKLVFMVFMGFMGF